MFSLPTYQQLSKEQDAINNLPLNGTHLVIGPPGTGKTVLAIYRAEVFKRGGKTTRFIVFNNTLKQYLEHATGEVDIGSDTKTYLSWFCKWYTRTTGKWVPQKKPYHPDWDQVMEILLEKGERVATNRLDHLVLDEAQDLPNEAFPVLAVTADSLTVFADENQRITDSQSTIEEIKTLLRLDRPYELRKNYRNSRPIAQFAACFYTGLRSGIPDLPDREGVKPRVMKTGPSIAREAEIVRRYAKSRPRHDIGVLLPKTDQQEQFMRAIRTELLKEKMQTDVQMYVSGSDEYGRIDFSKPGIKIINYQSAKGLEFEAVFLPRVDTFWGDPRSDGTKMIFYMLTSRAKEWLCLMHVDDQLPVVLKHVPEHLYERVPPV